MIKGAFISEESIIRRTRGLFMCIPCSDKNTRFIALCKTIPLKKGHNGPALNAVVRLFYNRI